jgi:hypothetical protein
LNSTATRLWKELAAGVPVDAAARKLAGVLGADPARACEEFAAFCCELGQRGLLLNTAHLAVALAGRSSRSHVFGTAPRIIRQARLHKPPGGGANPAGPTGPPWD